MENESDSTDDPISPDGEKPRWQSPPGRQGEGTKPDDSATSHKSGEEWEVRDGSIVEQPRSVEAHPLLARVYDRHDRLIAEQLPAGNVIEVAFGRYLHPAADLGIEAYPSNLRDVGTPALLGDARSIPLRDDSIDGIIGRRFLHHVPASDRPRIVREAARILRPGGRLIVLEGTPGLYRRLAKGFADRLDFLGENHNIYGHCSVQEVRRLLADSFDEVEERRLGSPLMVASIAEHPASARLFPIYERTQFVRWWTLFTATTGE